MQLTLSVRSAGTLPGTSKWFVNELKEREAYLKLGSTKSNHPAAFLAYKDGDQWKSFTLAAYGLFDSPEVTCLPFPDDFSRIETFCGTPLSKGAEKILYVLAEKAAELLHAAMEQQDQEQEVPTLAVQ